MLYPQATTYAIEALGYLASLEPGETVKSQQLSEQLHIPIHFLGKVLSQLVRKRLVRSVKGPAGGFSLARGASDISLYEVLKTLDSLNSLEERCVMGLRECNDKAPCAFHEYWTRFRSNSVEKSHSITVQDLAPIVTAKLNSRLKIL